MKLYYSVFCIVKLILFVRVKNVFIFNESARGSLYGIGTYIQQLLKCFQHKSNISLNLIELRSHVEEFYIDEINEYKIFYIPNVENIQREIYCRNILYIIYPILSEITSDNMIFIFNYYYNIEFVTMLRKMYPCCKIIVTIHFQHWCFLLNGNISHFRKIINANNSEILSDIEIDVLNCFKLERELYLTTDLIISLSEFTYNLLQIDYSIPKNKIALINNGLEDCKCFLSNNEKMKFKLHYSIHENEKIILFVGRLDKVKGLSFLIEAFKILLKDNSEYRLIVIGGGNYEKYLKEAQSCCGKILFLGHIEKELLYNFYQIADIGVQLSLHEQCSFVTIEMMMFNIPLLISDTTGLNEMIDDERFKTSVKFYEHGFVGFCVKECADKINNILNDNSAIKFQTRFLYENKYTLNRMRDSLFKLNVFAE